MISIAVMLDFMGEAEITDSLHYLEDVGVVVAAFLEAERVLRFGGGGVLAHAAASTPFLAAGGFKIEARARPARGETSPASTGPAESADFPRGLRRSDVAAPFAPFPAGVSTHVAVDSASDTFPGTLGVDVPDDGCDEDGEASPTETVRLEDCDIVGVMTFKVLDKVVSTAFKSRSVSAASRSFVLVLFSGRSSSRSTSTSSASGSVGSSLDAGFADVAGR